MRFCRVEEPQCQVGRKRTAYSVRKKNVKYVDMPRIASHIFDRPLMAIFLFALALRLTIRLATGVDGYWENGYKIYADLASNLAAGNGYSFTGSGPTAYRVPLYPLFIAAITRGGHDPWALIVGQAIVSSALAVIVGLTARRLYGNAAGIIAGTWCAAYPYYAWHDLSLQESGLFAALTALASYLLLVLRDNRGPLLSMTAGAALGAAILTRSMLLPFAVLGMVWLVLPDERKNTAARRTFSTTLVAAAMMATLGPWLLWSYAITGSFSLGTEGGQSLYAGASPELFARFPAESVDQSRAIIFKSIDTADAKDRDRYSRGNPARESQWYTRAAIRVMLDDPSGYARRALRKLAIAFGPRISPHHGLLTEIGYTAWWVPLLVLGLVGAWRDRTHWRRNMLFGMHFGAFSLVTGLVWAHTSHRSYLDVYLMVLAAPVLAGLVSRCRPLRSALRSEPHL
jgi:4-amino-4-deoxy-L-arabinose transferase-like glycosyltransferase